MAVTVTRDTPPTDLTGFGVALDYGYEKAWYLSGSTYTDITSNIQGGSGQTLAVGDYILIGKNAVARDAGSGNTGRFLDLHFTFNTPASSDAGVKIEYLNSSGAWKTLAVTDSTSGFTTDGSLTFVDSSFPTYTVWVPKKVNDSVYRCYVRISVTNSSVGIKEIGVGRLTVGKKYWYVAQKIIRSVTTDDDYGKRYHRSNITTPASVTIGAGVKRSVKIYWDTWTRNQRGNEGVLVLRRPDGKDPEWKGAPKNPILFKELDTMAQAVKAHYFQPISGATSKPHTNNGWVQSDYVLDDGLALKSYYSSSNGLYTYYVGADYIPRTISTIRINADTEADGNFNAIENAMSSDWGFEVLQGTMDNPETGYYLTAYRTGTHRIYRIWDNITITGYFGDEGFTLYLWGEICTKNANSVRFGLAGTGYTYDGANIIYTGGESENGRSFYKNVYFYDVTMRDDCWGNNRLYRHQLAYGCTIRNSEIIARATWEKFNPMDADNDFDGLIIYGLRYGMYIHDSSSVYPMNHIHVQNGNAFYFNSVGFPVSGEPYLIEAPNFRFSGENAQAGKFYVSDTTSWWSDLTLRLIDPEFDDTVRIGDENSTYPDNYFWYRSIGNKNWKIEVAHKPTIVVRDIDGNPVEGATIKQYNNSGLQETLTTNSDGEAASLVITDKHSAGTQHTSRWWRMDNFTNYLPIKYVISKEGYDDATITFKKASEFSKNMTINAYLKATTPPVIVERGYDVSSEQQEKDITQSTNDPVVTSSQQSHDVTSSQQSHDVTSSQESYVVVGY